MKWLSADVEECQKQKSTDLACFLEVSVRPKEPVFATESGW